MSRRNFVLTGYLDIRQILHLSIMNQIRPVEGPSSWHGVRNHKSQSPEEMKTDRSAVGQRQYFFLSPRKILFSALATNKQRVHYFQLASYMSMTRGFLLSKAFTFFKKGEIKHRNYGHFCSVAFWIKPVYGNIQGLQRQSSWKLAVDIWNFLVVDFIPPDINSRGY